MSLQFPKEEYNSESVQKFLENMIAFETKIKEDAKLKRKEENADRAKSKRDLKKLKDNAVKAKLTPRERKRLLEEAKRDRSAAGKKAAATRKRNKQLKRISTWEKAQAAAKKRRQNK